MKAIRVVGDERRLVIEETRAPEPGEGEVRIRVRAAALNRADLLQRQGRYPPPPGASEILGLDVAGEVDAVGPGAAGLAVGDRVCALLSGGGYAEYAVCPAEMAIPLPAEMSFEDGAAIPEVFLTAWQALVWLAELGPEETVLIHAGASGVGTAAIQLVRFLGAEPFATAGTDEKLELCRDLGATRAWSYREGPFAGPLLEATDGHGADVILDFVGAPYWDQHMECVAIDGRLILLATLGGSTIEKLRLRDLFRKRVRLIASTLRNRAANYRIRLTRDFIDRCLPAFSAGTVRPVVDRAFPWSEADSAHRYLAENKNLGKLILTISRQ